MRGNLKKVIAVLGLIIMVGIGRPINAAGVIIDETQEKNEKLEEELVEAKESESLERESIDTKEIENEGVEEQSIENKEENKVENPLERQGDTRKINFAQLKEIYIPEGWYTIHLFSDAKLSLDIKGGSDDNGAAAQIYHSNGSLAQCFFISQKENGWYTIRNISSGKQITVTDKEWKKGTKLTQNSPNESKMQEFKFYRNKNGALIIRPNVSGDFVCDITSGRLKSGSSVQIYGYNGSKAQLFQIKNVKMPGIETTVESGKYRIHPSEAINLSLDVSGGGMTNGTNIRLYRKNNTVAQEWNILKCGEWYKFKNVKSGKVLDIKGGSTKSGTNVWQYTSNSGKGQLFKFYKVGTNRYCLMSKLGTVLDCAGGVMQSGTNVQAYTKNGTKAQEWGIEKIVPPDVSERAEVHVEEGDYNLFSRVGDNLVLDIENASKVSGGNVQIYTANKTSAQSFYICKGIDGWYTVKNNGSGLCLDVKGGGKSPRTNLWQYKENGSDAQKFKFYDAGNGSVFIRSKLGTVIDVEDGKNSKNTNVQLYSYNRSNAQKWTLKKALEAGPCNMMATAVKTNIAISWNPIEGAVEYVVYEAEKGSNEFNKIATVTSTSYVREGRTKGKSYQYYVKARKKYGDRKIDTEAGKIVQTTVPPQGISTIKNLLKTGLAPMGTTMYVWGGGWNKADTAAGETTKKIGIDKRWENFYKKQNADYDYKKHKYKINDGLDCSGYVGFCVYNVMNIENNKEGYVYSSKKMASALANSGFGSYKDKSKVNDYKAGDIMSSTCNCCGHVWIVVGQCSDGSVVLMHCSPNGVKLSGTSTKSGNSNSKAIQLAKAYMKKYFPTWYQKYPNVSCDKKYLTHYSQMRWKKDVLSDPDGYQKKSAEEILKDLFEQ